MQRVPIILVLASACFATGEITDPGVTWLFPAMSNVQAHWRPGLGLPGEAAPGRPMLDLATQQVTITSLGIRTWTDQVRTVDLKAEQEHTAFWTETLVPVPGGGVLGFDAYDLREGLSVKGGDGHRETWESPAGIRFGGAWDLLYLLYPSRWASLGLEAWFPAWSNGETSLRAGLRLGSVMRMELGVGWHPIGVKARQDSSLTTWSDTLNVSGLRQTLDGRIAGRWDSLQFQFWGGLRTVEPRGDALAWKQKGRIGFGGVQAQGTMGGVALDGQVRMEAGEESFEVDRKGRTNTSTLERNSLAASLQIEPLAAWSTGQPRLVLEYASLGCTQSRQSLSDSLWLNALASAPPQSGEASVTRFGVIGQWAFFWSSFRFAPELGWHQIRRNGQLPSLWFAGLGDLEVSGGKESVMIWLPGFEVNWKRSGSVWRYHLSHPLNQGAILAMGWRHDILLSQSF
jgi:hypothetical protein